MVPMALQKRAVMWVNEREGSKSCQHRLTSFPYDLVTIPSPVYYMDCIVFYPIVQRAHEMIDAPASFNHLTHSPLDTNGSRH